MKTRQYKHRIFAMLLLLAVVCVGVRAQQKGEEFNADDIKAFVKVETTKKSVHISDTLTITYKLYSVQEVDRVLDVHFPRMKGFYVSTIRPENGFKEENVDGVDYKVYTLRKIILQPSAEGIKNIEAGYILLQYSRPTGRRVIDFFGNVREVVEQVRKELPIEATTIKVHNLIAT